MTTTKSSVRRVAADALARPADTPTSLIGSTRSIVIERVSPELDAGRWPVKRVVGDILLVTADILADGHGLLDAVVLVRTDDEDGWRETPMGLVDDDRWSGAAPLTRNRMHLYTIEAWRDAFGSWRDGLRAKVSAGVAVPNELEEGSGLLAQALARAAAAESTADARRLHAASEALGAATTDAERVAVLDDDALTATVRRHPDRSSATRYDPVLRVMVDRERARSGAWYELFPRSQGRDPARPTPTTLADAEWRLADIRAMGFDVVYLPPIHPIGTTNRKGRNNALRAEPGDVGSPYAIGSADGGHDAVAPELGGLPGLLHFREAVEAHGMELALDLALQVSPDHPYVGEHPEWFQHDPDGSIRYAENPPKKYQDIYPIWFHGPEAADREALWREWLRVVLVWVDRGVKIFRVDNPHTKPIAFWAWLIDEVHRLHPEVIFLSEAFTRPKMMRALAKAGFTQSYTYFTWRDTRDELRDYMTELAQTEMHEYFRPNLFTNTPDINPHHLDAGRPAFVSRYVLAATLSGSYGIYSGFELCENARLEDREEYLDSEKYEVRARDWDAQGNIKELIVAVNRLRTEWPALQRHDNLRFEPVSGETTLFYRKALPDGEVDPLSGHPRRWREPVYVAVNCDPRRAETARLHPDLPAIGIGWDDPFTVTDLLAGGATTHRGADIAVELDPREQPIRVFTIAAASSAEGR